MSPEPIQLVKVGSVAPSEGDPKRRAPLKRRLAERGLDRRRDRPEIPHVDGEPVEQSPATGTEPTGPGNERRIDFTTYTPLGTPTLSGPIPPDPSGDVSPGGVAMFVGNSYLMVSLDGGATFTEHDSSTFLPAAAGRPVDQVLIYVPHRRMFAWMMQHTADPATGDGTFRLAVAGVTDVERDVERAWSVYDFTSSDLGSPKVATDRQDLAYSETRLYMTTNLSGVGRVVMSLSLEDLDARRSVSWTRTDPLDGMYQFSDLSQQNDQNVNMVAIASDAGLQVMTLDDGAGTYGFHNVPVGQFPKVSDLVSTDPDGVDWLTRGVANVSASLVAGKDLWVAWDAAASADSDSPSYPNAHVRLARIDRFSWKAVEERQVWNADYAFAYCCLAAGQDGSIAYGVGVGGSHDYPNSCFGILGDLVVYYRDASSATPGSGAEPRWGDYITVRRSTLDDRRFAAFGYYTDKDSGGNPRQQPFYLSYGRP